MPFGETGKFWRQHLQEDMKIYVNYYNMYGKSMTLAFAIWQKTTNFAWIFNQTTYPRAQQVSGNVTHAERFDIHVICQQAKEVKIYKNWFLDVLWNLSAIWE